MSLREVPVVLVTGYLGSGKTTLMQHLLSQEKRKVALIVNDMGSINIDASLLNKTGNKIAQVELCGDAERLHLLHPAGRVHGAD